MRIHNNSTFAIDNIFIGKVNNEKYAICIFINGLSDHLFNTYFLAIADKISFNNTNADNAK
jgi:hypothetical protein